MSRAKFSSKFLSLFLRVLLVASWSLLVASFALAAIITIWPNFTVNAIGLDEPIFGVWKIYGNNISTDISWLGWLLIGVSSISFLFSIILQIIARKAKFKIGTRNQLIGYFSAINFPLIIFVVFAFIGTYQFNGLNSIPGVASVHSIFLTTNGAAALAKTSSFPLANGLLSTVTWIYWIFLILAFIFTLTVIFTTVKIVLRAMFSRTFDKNYSE